jgi:ribosome-interacting GTPase 1
MPHGGRVPANLTPQYFEAERRYKEARTAVEKVEALRAMLAIMPKHKGTEKLQADLRRRLAKHQDDIEVERQRKGGAHASPGFVKREGAGQVVLVGAPNAGKSSLLGALTHAHPKIAPYPFTTREPLAGMMPFEDVQVQIVDAPPVAESMEGWMAELVRRADRALLVANLASDAVLDELDGVVQHLARRSVRLQGEPVPEEGRGEGAVETLVAATQCDAPGAAERRLLLAEALGAAVPRLPEPAVVAVSAATGEGLESLRRTLFEALRVIRVYTKLPGHKPDHERPFVLPRHASVLDLARLVHRDMAETLHYARLWGSSRFEGQTVQRDQELQDGDVVELHGS